MYLKLKHDTQVGNIHVKGEMIRATNPDFWNDRPRLARNIWVACYRQDEELGISDQVESAVESVPRAIDLPPVMESLEAPYRDCLLLSDVHVPFHDETILAEALVFAKNNGLRRAVLNGDTLDMLGFSSYDGLTSEDVRASLSRCGELFEAMLDHGITEIHMTTGNHEHRFERKVGSALGFRELLGHVYVEMDPGAAKAARRAVKCTNRFWLRYYDTPDSIDWQIHHQFNYRQKRLSTAMDLALKVTNCHTATGHEHHWGMSVTENGKWFAVNLPTCQAEERTEYKERRKGVYTSWVRGFGWLIDGVPGLWWHEAPEQWKRRMLRPAPGSRRKKATA